MYGSFSRLVHLVAMLCLSILAPNADTDEKKLTFLNDTLAPELGRVMQRKGTKFKKPERGNVWSLKRINGTGYRRLLHKNKGFKLSSLTDKAQPALARPDSDLVATYQKAWDDFGALTA